ncbi:MAG TPA: amidohydrolase family protein [Bryobacteraceae bacterium]|nr:amidohydrolase family protein [Bryobacteraceae bacterium]
MRLPLLFVAAAISLSAQSGTLTIHMILHAIGEERYQVTPSDGELTLSSTFEYSDRGNTRTTTATMRMKSDYTPLNLEVKGRIGPGSSLKIEGNAATVQEGDASRTLPVPEQYAAIFGSSPFAMQAMMMRYWIAHGKPAQLPMLRAKPGADPIRIEAGGHDSVSVGGKTVTLDRYNIANLMFGREILWTNPQGDLAAAMTFAGGLPMEAVRTEYEPAFPQLYRSGIAQEMANLAALGRQVTPERTGAYSIVGATLVDATGAAPVSDSVVIIRDGRIAAAGSREKVAVPRGIPVVEAKGQTLLPGLWEMHIHFSGVEFGPALLAAGVTTARDCGGEFDYLVAQRNALERGGGLGPRLLLAGLVDAGGLKAFGHVTAETPEEGRAVVNRYHDAGFQQIKLYTFLTPEVIQAITAEAHRLNMTVTGHVPQVFNAFQGVEAGMDQINHLNYVSNMMRGTPGGRGPIDINSEAALKAIHFFKEHHTVVDPTAGWGEMSGHSKEVDVATFEPGILKSPFVLDAKFRGMGGPTTAEQMRTRTAQTIAVIGALHKAGIPIVPGSDTGLVGYGLLRELELYVQAGMTPLEAIQSATIVSARAMNFDRDSGTIEAGKRADLILVNGDPLANIGDLRRVSRVISQGRVYDAAALWRSVGFHPASN